MHATEIEIRLPHLRLAAQAWGKPSAKPLLALHGWLDNSASFAAIAPQLATEFYVVAIDLPGHGLSEHLPAGTYYNLAAYTEWVLAAAQALGWSHFGLLGHSLGGGIASLAAAAAPQYVTGLWLIEALGPLSDSNHDTLPRFRRALQDRVRNPRQRVFPYPDAALAARVTASGLATDYARAIVHRGLRQLAEGYIWSTDPRLTLASPTRLSETQILALLAGIEAPTRLLLATPETPYLPMAMMRTRAAQVRDIQISTLTGGHHLHIEQPAAVIQQLFPSLPVRNREVGC